MLLGPTWFINQAQIASPSVALPAELVLQDGQPDFEFDSSAAQLLTLKFTFVKKNVSKIKSNFCLWLSLEGTERQANWYQLTFNVKQDLSQNTLAWKTWILEDMHKSITNIEIQRI